MLKTAAHKKDKARRENNIKNSAMSQALIEKNKRVREKSNTNMNVRIQTCGLSLEKIKSMNKNVSSSSETLLGELVQKAAPMR